MLSDQQLDEAICVICLDSCPPRQHVRVRGLVKTPHYNGRIGTVQGRVDGSERLKVVLGRDRKVLSLKPENVVVIDDGAPIQSGCACRGDAGLAHVACRVMAAETQAPEQRGRAWDECPTCKERFTGAMQLGLAEARWTKVRGREQEDYEWQDAASMMANALNGQGRYGEAEQLQRKLLAVQQRQLGAEYAVTLGTATNLGNSLWRQGRYGEAEKMYREALPMMQRTFGAGDPATLAAATNLACTLSGQGKHTEAEKIQREVLAVQQQELGAEHSSTLLTAVNLANSLSGQGKHAEAEKMQREVLAAQKRVLGAEHPSTLVSAGNVAESISKQGKYAEAEKMQREVLAVQQLKLGAEHPDTLWTAAHLANSLSKQGRHAEAEKMHRQVLALQKRRRALASGG